MHLLREIKDGVIQNAIQRLVDLIERKGCLRVMVGSFGRRLQVIPVDEMIELSIDRLDQFDLHLTNINYIIISHLSILVII